MNNIDNFVKKSEQRLKKKENKKRKWVKHGHGEAWSPKFLDKPTKNDKKKIKEKIKKKLK